MLQIKAFFLSEKVYTDTKKINTLCNIFIVIIKFTMNIRIDFKLNLNILESSLKQNKFQNPPSHRFNYVQE